MTMHQAWTIWSANQPELIVETAGSPTPCKRPAPRLDQLNARILEDIGMNKYGIPVTRR